MPPSRPGPLELSRRSSRTGRITLGSGGAGVREEAGVEADVVRLASVSWKPRRSEHLFQFVCRIVGGELCTTEESDDFGYFALDDLPQHLSPALRRRLLTWSLSPGETVLLTDDGPSGREFLEQHQSR